MRSRRKFSVPCAILLGTLPESVRAHPATRPALTRGSCVSPSVHRQSALCRERGRLARTSVERRRACADRAADRSGNRPAARLRVRRLRGSRGRRRGDPAIQPAAVQGTAAGGQRGAAARRPSGRARPRPGGFSGPRPGGPSGRSRPRPGGFGAAASRRIRARGRRGGGAAPGPRSRNFGPDAPPKNKRKPPRKDADRGPQGPIKERPVSRLYDADEDWRAKDEEVDVDNIATTAKEDDELATQEDELDDEQD